MANTNISGLTNAHHSKTGFRKFLWLVVFTVCLVMYELLIVGKGIDQNNFRMRFKRSRNDPPHSLTDFPTLFMWLCLVTCLCFSSGGNESWNYMFNHRTSINLFYMVDKLFTVYTNINIEMKTAVREGGVVLIIFKWKTNNFRSCSHILSWGTEVWKLLTIWEGGCEDQGLTDVVKIESSKGMPGTNKQDHLRWT